jgi:predicted transglutaminase-like cysteine proteinase
MCGQVPVRNFAGWLLIVLAAICNPTRTIADANRETVTTSVTRDDAQVLYRVQSKSVSSIIPAKPTTSVAMVSEPFGLNVVPVTSGGLVTTWRHLEADILAESGPLARCRADAELCSSAAQHLLAIIAEGRAHTGRSRIAVINRAINLAIRPNNNLTRQQISDHWRAPIDTLSTGRGDCKDYAIVKYVALLEAGIAEDDVSVVILHNLAGDEDHAVVAVRLDGNWVVLDNRWFTLVEDFEMRRVVPLFVLNHDGIKQYASLQSQIAQMTP